jgi:pimeloyl-ACP methyl ester carboxylesterase
LPRLQVDSATFDYQEAGDGVPVIFIPGITEFKEAFAFQFRGLQDRYRVISYDVRRGLKRSTDYTLELLGDDLRKLLAALELDSAVLCGHSFGGLIALQFALRYPECTKALILSSTFASPPTVPQSQLLSWISSAGHPFHRSLGTRFKLHIARLLKRDSAETMTDQAAAIRSVARQADEVSPTTVQERLHLISKADYRSRMREILSPTLVVVGSREKPVFLTGAQELYERITDASLEVIEGAGHFTFLTRHDEFNAAVDEFLSERLGEIG